jgi:single-strand selective monofunctional uracil DNA glycosylase
VGLVMGSRALAAAVEIVGQGIVAASPLLSVYNPLVYAREPQERYLTQYGTARGGVLLVGMNPGPYGMLQTGVPFGDVTMVRDWLGISGTVGQPAVVHPKRPVAGFACHRSEASGTRLWGWARARWGTPAAFFARYFVANYCPLAFFDEAGRNVTPDKLPVAARTALHAACDHGIRDTVAVLQPEWVLGIGAYATTRLREALESTSVNIGTLPHPSPANPAANRGWAALADAALAQLGIEEPRSDASGVV